MKSRSVASIVALTAVTASGCGVGIHFADYRHTTTLADAHLTGVTNLRVEAGDGHVVVNTGSGDGVTVHRVLHYQSGRPYPGQRLSDGTLTFSTGCSRCRVDYDLTVPASVRVQARTDGGRITIAGVASVDAGTDSGSVTLRHIANGVNARSDSGFVHIEDAGGDVKAGTDSGAIRATGLRSSGVAASTGSGSVNLGFVSVPSSVRATSDSGSLHITLPNASYDVDVKTDSGGRHVNVPTSPTAPAKVYLTTDSGSVHVDPA